jgi:hypothetical protein
MRELCRFRSTKRSTPKLLFRKELRPNCRQSRMPNWARREDAGLQERGSPANFEIEK